MAVKPGLRTINASEHLTSLGWAGPGHSLDSHTSNRGLAKPLLVTHKSNNRGLGSRSAKERQADQWWLNAFDTALRQLNGPACETAGATSALERVQEHGMGKGGLYGWFKRGEVMGSTFEELPVAMKQAQAKEQKTSRALKAKAMALQVQGNEPASDLEHELAALAVRSILPLLAQDASTTKSASRPYIRAELKRLRRIGQLRPAEPLSTAASKQHEKNMKRRIKALVKTQLRQEVKAMRSRAKTTDTELAAQMSLSSEHGNSSSSDNKEKSSRRTRKKQKLA